MPLFRDLHTPAGMRSASLATFQLHFESPRSRLFHADQSSQLESNVQLGLVMRSTSAAIPYERLAPQSTDARIENGGDQENGVGP